jgi:ribosomal protein L32E
LFSSQKYFRNNTIKTKRYERCSKYWRDQKCVQNCNRNTWIEQNSWTT